MCIIIERHPQINIDKEAFAIACDNNPDGYGLVVADGDGRCTVLKALDYEIEELYELVNEDYADSMLMLHLRYTTAGETNRRNLHPFPILEYATDGVDLWMAHNGTLSDYRHGHNSDRKWESDTRNFVRSYVRPLFKRLIKGMDIKDILTDPFVYKLLDSQLSTMSVLSFLDGFGNSLQVNPLGNGGKYEDGMWYSNEYSFDARHRSPKTSYNTGYQNHHYQSYGDESYEEWWNRSNDNGGTTSSHTQEVGKDTMQQTFSEKYNLEEQDIFTLNDDALEAFQEEAPQDLVLLAKELLHRLYESELDLARTRTKQTKAEKKIEELVKELKEHDATA